MTPLSFRPRVEQLDGRCLPSANPAAALAGGALGSPPAAAHAGAPEPHAVPIRLSTHITSDGSLALSFSGVGGHLGRWAGVGSLGDVAIDPAADRGSVRGTVTIVAANGDRLFAAFSASWQLSSGAGEVAVTFTGGTGRFAGAAGGATEACRVTADPASPLTFACDSLGTGSLILAHR